MATLFKNGQSITVPEETVKSYLKDGWATTLAPVTLPTKKSGRSKPRAGAAGKKEPARGVSIRSGGDEATTSNDGEPVQPVEDGAGGLD